MEQNLNCDIVKDLLPNYIEHLTSVTTNQSVEDHLNHCSGCKQIYNQMTGNVSLDSVPEEQDFKKFLNKTKFMYSLLGLLALGGIAIITCLIVDIAVTHTLSWSLIVTAGIVYGYTVGYFLIMGGKRRVIKAMVFISIFTIPLLAVINEVVMDYTLRYIGYYHLWFWKIGVPITLLWLGIIWLVVLFNKAFRWNVFHCIGLLCTLSIPGTYYTNHMVGSVRSSSAFVGSMLLNIVISSIVAIVFYTIGFIYQIKVAKKQKNLMS